MVETALIFTKYLETKGKKYDYDEREGQSDVVTIRFGGENCLSISIRFFFDQDGKSVAVRCFSICRFNDEKLAAGLLETNALNNEYRWVRFSIDNDNESMAGMDAVITKETSAEVCYELMVRMVNIIDDIYPRLMKARWC